MSKTFLPDVNDLFMIKKQKSTSTTIDNIIVIAI